jgi:hypothetical protein
MSFKNKISSTVASALLLAAGSAAAADYYVVVPVPNHTTDSSAVNVALSGFTLPSAQVGFPYQGFDLKTLLSVTGDASYTGFGVRWSIASGSLPAGLTLNSNGTISGTPTAGGTASFQVLAAYKTKAGQQAYQVVVADIKVGLSPATPPQAIVGETYSFDVKPLLSVSGDTTYSGAGVTWSLVSGSLPAGLSLSASGVISGTPTGASSAPVTIQAAYRGVDGQQTYQMVSLTISVRLANATLPLANVGTSYSYDFKPLVSVSGDSSYSVSAVQFRAAAGATLPAGLNLSAAGVLSGTPSATTSGQSFSVIADYRGLDGAQQYSITVNPGFFNFNPTIAATTTNYNLYGAARAAGWDGVAPLTATVTINGGVYVGGTTTGSYAFATGSGFPAQTTLKLINNGALVGKGGDGGSWGIVGGGGGPALYAQYPIAVFNNGTIAGGGGGGGGSNRASVRNVLAGGAGGGGGQGYGTSAGGAADPAFSGAQYPQAQAGTGGNINAAGTGGAGISSGTFPNQFSAPVYSSSASGGHGGALGQAGAGAIAGWIADGTVVPAVAGGPAGYAVVGAANVTWSTAGSVLGPQQ